jgi:hypothetical protein
MLLGMIESRIFTATIRPATEGHDGGAWVVTVPNIGETSVDDVLEAEDAAHGLVCAHLGVETWQERHDIGIQLVDVTGGPLFAFPLIACPIGRTREVAEYAASAAHLPAGCQWSKGWGYPALVCLRPGATLLDAIGGLAGELRQRGFGSDFCDVGWEKLYEWWGDSGRRTRLIAQLLLMAVHRAEDVGLPAEEVVGFMRSAYGML